MKTPKFLLCENPIADKSDGRSFIIHTREPRILAEIFAFEEPLNECLLNSVKSNIRIGATLEYGSEYFIFSAIFVEKIEMDADKLAGIMRRMADWYEAYLKWEDSQHG